MCGIGGILRVTQAGERHEPIPESWLDALDEGIAWRGPDGAGRFRDRVTGPDGATFEVALVHRRLSIIDHETGGQPFVVRGCPGCIAANREHARQRCTEAPHVAPEDDLTAVVFNGCIYNHRELRAELESLGHVFTSDHSDTEVIAHAWSQWRTMHPGAVSWTTEPEVARRLEGMYAFLLWNRGEATLWSGRDQHGEKPLYTALHESEVSRCSVAASTVGAISAVLPAMGLETGIDASGTARSIVMGFPAPMLGRLDFYWTTLPLKGVVEHGTCLVDQPGMNQPKAEFEAEFNSKSSLVGCTIAVVVVSGLALAMIAALVLLVRGIIAWFEFLISVFTLTGLILLVVKLIVPWRLARGQRIRRLARTSPDRIDRVLSEAVASRLEADVPLGCFLSGGIDSSLIASYAHRHLGALRTFCVRMPDDRYDESVYAEAVAEAIGTDHLTIDCDASHAADDLRHLIDLLDLPFGDSSILPAYWLCRAARPHIKVALSGDGGDEMFYGYERYRAAAWMMRLVAPAAWYVRGRLDRSDPRGREERRARFFDAATGGGYTDLVGLFGQRDAESLLGRTALKHLLPRVGSSASCAREWDRFNYLPGDLMRKIDTASMAVGLEVRSPFLSRSVRAAADAIPAGSHMYGEPKHVLRELARLRFGPQIANRPKQGFAIPISEWWRTDFGGLGTLLFDLLDRPEPFGAVHEALPINMGFVRQMIDEHWAAGGLPARYTTGHVRKRDHGQRLFGLVTLALWARTVHRRDAEDTEKRACSIR